MQSEQSKLGKVDVKLSEDFDFNDSENMIQFKIVYWGPGESGKTTNFFRLREKFDLLKLTRGYSIETTEGRTLWEDSLYLLFKFTLHDVKFNIICHVVTCTGQERFLSTREYVLDGADGIMFVGDSDPRKIEQNKRSFRELVSFAKPKNIPYLVQLNKRDLEGAIPIKEFKLLSIVYELSPGLTGDNDIILRNMLGVRYSFAKKSTSD